VNKGFDSTIIAEFQAKLNSIGSSFLPVEEEDNSAEYFHFHFIGKHEGRPVIYDAVLTTLRLEHESELYELAEERVAERYPQYKKIEQSDQDIDQQEPNQEEEEMGLYLAETILEIQEEGTVKVKEYLDIDRGTDFGIGINASLQVDQITPLIIERFIADFNNEKLELDDTLYDFQAEEDED
jgi:hypothetical protein